LKQPLNKTLFKVYIFNHESVVVVHIGNLSFIKCVGRLSFVLECCLDGCLNDFIDGKLNKKYKFRQVFKAV